MQSLGLGYRAASWQIVQESSDHEPSAYFGWPVFSSQNPFFFWLSLDDLPQKKNMSCIGLAHFSWIPVLKDLLV